VPGRPTRRLRGRVSDSGEGAGPSCGDRRGRSRPRLASALLTVHVAGDATSQPGPVRDAPEFGGHGEAGTGRGERGERRSDALVFFGATGDLAHRCLPALYAMSSAIRSTCPSSVWPTPLAVRAVRPARESVETYGRHRRHGRVPAPQPSLRPSTAIQNVAFTGCAQRWRGEPPLHYLPIPPSLFDDVVTALGGEGCASGAGSWRKPFGRDLASARELTGCSTGSSPRIDLPIATTRQGASRTSCSVRFANCSGAIWHRNHVASVQVTMAESSARGRERFSRRRGHAHVCEPHPADGEPPSHGAAAAGVSHPRQKVRTSARCDAAHRRVVRGVEATRPPPGGADSA